MMVGVSSLPGQWTEIEKCMEEMDSAGQQQLGQRLRKLYGEFEIPIEVRKALAPLIEGVPSDDSNRSQEDIDGQGTELYDEVVQELQKQANEKKFPDNSSLTEAMEKFQKRYEGNPISLVNNIRTCLMQEKEVLATQNTRSDGDNRRKFYQEGCSRITGHMTEMHRRIELCERKLYDLQSHTEKTLKLREAVIANEEKNKKRPGNKTDRQKKSDKDVELLKQQLAKDQEALQRFKQESENYLVALCDELLVQVPEVWKCIDQYELQQKLNILEIKMGPPEGALKDLNDMCEVVNQGLVSLAQLFTSMSDIHRSFLDDPNKAKVQEKKNTYDSVFQKHLERIVVIDSHPNQVVKVSKGRSCKFNMSLRILGPFHLGLQANRPEASANLHAEKDLSKEMQPNKPVSQGMPIQGAEKVEAKFDNSTKQLRVNFNPVQIANLKRPSDGRSREERVTEYKYGMIFSVKLYVDGTQHLVKKLSLPLILTTQSSQEWAAKGTLVWDAAFSKENRSFYEDEPKVSWENLGNLINTLFKESTNRPLTTDNLNYLAQRVFDGYECDDYLQYEITKDKFIKENMENAPFSLWKWIYACLNLIKLSLRKEWERGLIMGFVSREKAGELLSNCDVGTFILRFKASEILDNQSATSTAVLAPSAVVDMNGGNRKVSHVDANLTQPKLAKRNLARCLQVFQVSNPEHPEIKSTVFKTLYPNVPFDEAFGDLIQEDEPRRTDYDPVLEKLELQVAHMNFGPRSIPASPACSSTSGMDVPSEGAVSPRDQDILAQCVNFLTNDEVMDTDSWLLQPGQPGVIVEQEVELNPNGESSSWTALLTPEEFTSLNLEQL